EIAWCYEIRVDPLEPEQVGQGVDRVLEFDHEDHDALARAPERAVAADRPGLSRVLNGDPRRSDTELPRPWVAATRTVLGKHAVDGPSVGHPGAVGRGDPLSTTWRREPARTRRPPDQRWWSSGALDTVRPIVDEGWDGASVTMRA